MRVILYGLVVVLGSIALAMPAKSNETATSIGPSGTKSEASIDFCKTIPANLQQDCLEGGEKFRKSYCWYNWSSEGCSDTTRQELIIEPKSSADNERPRPSMTISRGEVTDGWRRFIGKAVRPGPITSCFTWQGRYACFAVVAEQQNWIVWTDEWMGADKEKIDRHCRNMAMAGRCRPWPLVFEIESGETNMQGTVAIYQAKRIWGPGG